MIYLVGLEEEVNFAPNKTEGMEIYAYYTELKSLRKICDGAFVQACFAEAR